MCGHCIIQKESALRNISENLVVFWNWSSKAVRKACGSISTASTSYMHKHYQATFELLLCTSLVWNFTFSIIENMNCVFFVPIFVFIAAESFMGGGGGEFLHCHDFLWRSSLLHIRSKKWISMHLFVLPFSEMANFHNTSLSFASLLQHELVFKSWDGTKRCEKKGIWD